MHLKPIIEQKISREQLFDFIYTMRVISHSKPCVFCFIYHNNRYIPCILIKLRRGEGKSYIAITKSMKTDILYLRVFIQKLTIVRLLRHFMRAFYVFEIARRVFINVTDKQYVEYQIINNRIELLKLPFGALKQLLLLGNRGYSEFFPSEIIKVLKELKPQSS